MLNFKHPKGWSNLSVKQAKNWSILLDNQHDLLIIGYTNSNDLIIVNYGEDKTLSKKIISMNSLNHSFTDQVEGRSFEILWDKINIMPTALILDNIRQYISPKDPYKLKYYDEVLNPQHEMSTGIYAIKSFLNSLKSNFYLSSHLNGICLLNEHKNSLMNTLVYLNKLGEIDNYLISKYEKIVSTSERIKINYLKF